MSEFKTFMNIIKSGSVTDFYKYYKEEYLEKVYEWPNWRPIHYACYYGKIEIVKLLIELKCDIESCTENGWRPIHLACEYDKTEIFKILIEKKCNISVSDKRNQYPIYNACKSGSVEITKMLIGMECDIEVQNDINLRPIHIACEFGHTEIVKILVERKCNIEACDKWDLRPIHYACQSRNAEIVKILIDLKCDFEVCNRFNQRPIHVACERGNHKIVELLVGLKCDIEACDLWNQRPIHFACKFNNDEIVKTLIEMNCNIDAISQFQQSPIDVARECLNSGIIDIINGYKLLFACKDGNIKCVESLINNNCNIEFCDKNNRRAIHWACQISHVKIVQLLIEKQCDIDAKDKNDFTPIYIARQAKNKKLVKILNSEKVRCQIEKQILLMDLKCLPVCDHRLCSMSLQTKKFAKGELVGKGSFGKVYRCRGSETKREFAIKYIPLVEIYDKKQYVENDINEFMVTLQHDSIVQYFGTIKISKYLSVFMEFLPEGSLEDKIKNEKLISSENVIRYSRQMLEGLEFIHANTIVHRNIKPANFLLDKRNNVKIADFGLGKLLSALNDHKTCVLKCFRLINFVAPEVINGQPFTFSSDIWSLGCTIFNMITGEPLFAGLNTLEIISNLQSQNELEIPLIDSHQIQKFVRNMLYLDSLKRPNASVLLQYEIFTNCEE